MFHAASHKVTFLLDESVSGVDHSKSTWNIKLFTKEKKKLEELCKMGPNKLTSVRC